MNNFDPYGALIEVCKSSKLFEAVLDTDEPQDLTQLKKPVAQILFASGELSKQSIRGFHYTIDTTLDVILQMPLKGTHAQLTKLRNDLLMHLHTNIENAPNWQVNSFGRGRYSGDGGTPLVEIITFEHRGFDLDFTPST